MSTVTTFKFQELHQVRVVVIADEPWFCLKDVCDVLTILNPRRVAADILDQAGVRKTYVRSGGQKRQLTFINEPNLYRVIFRSNKPEARQFQDWVFNEVLPAIRKHGHYQLLEKQQAKEPPRHSQEPLTAKQHADLQWLVSHVASQFSYRRVCVSAIWNALRRATCNPSPNPFTIHDLPAMTNELRRILEAVASARAITRKFEADFLRQVIRKGRSADVFGLLPERDAIEPCQVLLPEKLSIVLDEFEQAKALPIQR